MNRKGDRGFSCLKPLTNPTYWLPSQRHISLLHIHNEATNAKSMLLQHR